MAENVKSSGPMVTEVRVYFTFVDRDEMDLGTFEVNISGAEAFTVPRKKEVVHLRFQGRQYRGKVSKVINDIRVDASGGVKQQLFVSCKNAKVI